MIRRILFVCKYNRFRSKIAEALFKKFNKNKNIKVKSAGIIIGKYPLDKIQIEISKKLDINLSGKPQGISTDLLKWQDLIIIVADDVPERIFNNSDYGKKTLVWKIKDAKSNNKKEIEKIIILIKKRIIKLKKDIK